MKMFDKRDCGEEDVWEELRHHAEITSSRALLIVH